MQKIATLMERIEEGENEICDVLHDFSLMTPETRIVRANEAYALATYAVMEIREASSLAIKNVVLPKETDPSDHRSPRQKAFNRRDMKMKMILTASEFLAYEMTQCERSKCADEVVTYFESHPSIQWSEPDTKTAITRLMTARGCSEEARGLTRIQTLGATLEMLEALNKQVSQDEILMRLAEIKAHGEESTIWAMHSDYHVRQSIPKTE